jgi:polysaccharide export outer membrane protein
MMKRSITRALKTILILILVSCVSQKGVHLVNLTTKESPGEARIILTTTKPVEYKATKLENPPGFIISFPEDKVYSSEKDLVVVNKGPIKKIKAEYSQAEGEIQPQLNLVIVELERDLPYEISNYRSSIIIIIKDVEQPPVTANERKAKTESQPQIRKQNPQIEPGYLIGPRDVLDVEVWKEPDISREVVVNHQGEIRLPPIRKISAMGLSVPQLEEKLQETLSKYLIDPIVFVKIKEHNSQRVIALGETTTGMYTLKRETTLVEFLGQIGGPTDNADILRIKLIKKDGRVSTYDLNELLGDPQKFNKVFVTGGDTVYVPPLELNKVFVLGEVNSPRSVILKGKMTVLDAITEAGGYTRDAVTKSVMVIRGELGSQKGIRVNLSRILKEADIGQNIELEPGDIVYVPMTFIVHIERFLRDVALPVYWYFWFIR